MLRTATLARVLLVRPGATDFDDQGRMKGSLDMPLSDRGVKQAESLAQELAATRVRTIFSAPCESAQQTSQHLAQKQKAAGHETKVKVIEPFQNLDHGLWHGKLIDEVKRNHPRVYRQGEDHPEEFCPPGGEPVAEAKERVQKALRKCIRKASGDTIALVIPEPMATVVESVLSGKDLTSVWKNETDAATWTLIESDL